MAADGYCYMRRPFPVRCKEDEVTGHDVCCRHRFAELELLSDAARKEHTVESEDVLCKTAAVESIRRLSTVPVWRTAQFERGSYDLE
jgi:hypothetical protein